MTRREASVMALATRRANARRVFSLQHL